MGWFWNSSGDKEDAISSLDPRLKDFLDRETSQQQRHQSSTSSRTSPPPPPSSISPSFAERLGLRSSPPSPPSTPSEITTVTPPEATPAVPPQSLYQDGRYSHLWTTYTPPTAAQASTSSQSQLETLLTSYNSRRGDVSRAALENCVEEHLAENACLGSGPWARKLRGCREESKRFGKCFELQGRLFRAMGWMHPDVTGEQQEGMRNRADEIWTEVCRRDDAVALAKREGRPEPMFAPLEVPRGRWVKLDREEDEEKLLARFGEEKREEMRRRMERMSKTDRLLEVRLELAEAEANRAYGEKVGRYIAAEQEERRERKERGQSTIGDWLKSLGGWS